MKPKITVITITYNAEALLQPTLDSVLVQSYPYVEHLFVDGASKDGTMDIVREYERREGRLARDCGSIGARPWHI